MTASSRVSRRAPDPSASPGKGDGGPTFTSFRLPFGVVYAQNLTPDPETGLLMAAFIAAMRTGKHRGAADGRAISADGGRDLHGEYLLGQLGSRYPLRCCGGAARVAPPRGPRAGPMPCSACSALTAAIASVVFVHFLGSSRR